MSANGKIFSWIDFQIFRVIPINKKIQPYLRLDDFILNKLKAPLCIAKDIIYEHYIVRPDLPLIDCICLTQLHWSCCEFLG